MSKTFEFEQTSIPSQYSMNLKDNFGMLWVDTRTADLCRAMFAAIADTLKLHQTKDTERVGMIMKDEKGNFKLGAILVYTKPEEGSEEDSGNWYLQMTLDESDMTDLDVVVDNHSDVFVRCAGNEASNICYGRFRSTELMYQVFNTLIDTIVSFLDVNANETEEVTVNLRGVFTASVAIESGVKVMSIVPGEYIKQIIKNDAAL